MTARARPGDVVLGRYRIEASLGRGAAGFSHRGVDLETEAAVVVKELPADRPELFERYLGEVALLPALGDGCVDPEGLARLVRPLATGEEHGQPWSVRPFLEGVSLRDRLRQGALREDEVRTLLGDVARVLRAAHRENLVLRNLKPENVFVESGARARVTGLGTGCFLTRAHREGLGVELGGLRYVAPEQVLDARRVDRTTDLFVLGLLLYESLAGEPMLPGGEVDAVLDFLASPEEIPLPPGNAELANLALRLASFHPGERPRDIAGVLATLAPWLLEPEIHSACEGCEEGLPVGATYCVRCGRTTRGPCPLCGRSLPLGAGFCTRCGKPDGVPRERRLVGVTGGYEGETVSLDDVEVMRVGRAPSCDLSFDGRDHYVSRHQCKLSRRRGVLWLEGGDWESGRPTTNGTLLNGRNTDGVGPVLMRRGDRLRVGDSFFRYEEAEA